MIASVSSPQILHRIVQFRKEGTRLRRLAKAFSMRSLFLALFLGATLGTAFAAPAPDQTVAGFWQQVDNQGHVGAWFYFTEVNGLYQGRLVKMFKPPPGVQTPLVTVCTKCGGNQKDAPMLGLTIVNGMRRDGRKYDDGTILDPRDGNVYHAQMELSPDGQKLSVRGYLGIPLLGQTQVWNRLPDDAIPGAQIPKESFGPAAQ
jgi:uncharacterized protein (DUF2147 family)